VKITKIDNLKFITSYILNRVPAIRLQHRNCFHVTWLWFWILKSRSRVRKRWF